jgi:hypothetical protein
MRLVLAASLAAGIAAAPFGTCARTPAAGTTFDCPDGRAFTVAFTDSSTALLTLDRTTHRLTRPTRPATRWADSTVTLTTAGDTARLERAGTVLHAGCLRRNPELRR